MVSETKPGGLFSSQTSGMLCWNSERYVVDRVGVFSDIKRYSSVRVEANIIAVGDPS